MSIIAQIAVVLMIVIVGGIIFYANRGLETAQQEGERFLDEWELKQQKKEGKRKEHAGEAKENKSAEEDSGFTAYDADEEEISREDSGRKMEPDNVIPLSAVCDKALTLMVFDEQKKKITTAKVDHFPYFIGRDPKNDLVLNDLYVALFHCKITEKDGEIILCDRGSVNKIYADGKNVDEMILSDQSRFYLGNYEFAVEIRQHRSHPTILASKAERISI